VRGPRPSVVQPKEQILPPAIDTEDAPAADFFTEGLRASVQEQGGGRRVDPHIDDALADGELGEVAADRLHLGEFRHIPKRTAWACAAANAGAYLCPMITHLAGRLARLDVAGPAVEVDVGGVRYEVLVPLFLWPEIERLAGEADLEDEDARPPIALHISYHASPNNPVPVLVGFLRRAERDFFRKFVSVEGMGPAKAVRALTISVSAVARAIEQEDRALLTKLPGVGARQADKIIAALRGKVLAEAAMHDARIAEPVDPAALERGRIAADAIAAITGLGYSRSEAKRWVEEALAADPSLDSVEALTLAVLRARGSERP
jgi:holliday junction DNA helicase RuvA